MDNKNLDELFEAALRFHHYANTAYPLTPRSLKQYELHDEEEIRKCVIENITQQKKLNLMFTFHSVNSGADSVSM